MGTVHEDSMAQRVRYARGKFIAMAAAFSLTAFNDNFYRTAAITLAKAAGLAWFQFIAMFVFGLPYLVFAAPVGWLADRFPKRRIVIGAKALEIVAVALGAIGICTSHWSLMAAMIFLMGLQSAIFSPALCGAIPELYPVEYVTSANAKLRAATTTAILFGTALAPKALDTAGVFFSSIPRGQVVVAAIVLAVTVIGFLASLSVPHRPAAAPKARFPWAGPFNTFVELWRIGKDRVLALTVASVVFVYFIGSVQILLILDLEHHEYNLSGGMTSLLLLCEGVGIIAGGLLSTLFARGERWHRVLVVAVWGLAGVTGLIALVPYAPQGWQVGLLLALVWFAGVLGGLMLIPAEAFTQVRPAPDRKGAVLAAANCAVFAGIMVTGLVAAGLMDLLKQEPTTCFGAIGVMAALMGTALYIGLPRSGVRKTDTFLIWLTNRLLRLRYRIEVKGLDEVAERGTDAVLFLPNHPALIDPVMMVATLHARFRPIVWADQDQIDRPVIRTLAPRFGVWPVPAVSRYGTQSAEDVARAIGTSVEALRGGRCLLLYPSGHVYRSRLEDLRGNTAVHSILQQLPQVRVVLVRTRGLWGSSFSWASGEPPSVGRTLRKGLVSLLLSGVFFASKRPLSVEFSEPQDLPRAADRETLSRFLEAFYNEGAEPNTYVPRSIWEKGGVQQMPEPFLRVRPGDVAAVPEATRALVLEHLGEAAGLPVGGPDDHLARDLGLDSLDRTELIAWLEQEFGFPQGNAESLETVADVMLAACGEAVAAEPAELAPVPAKWLEESAREGRIQVAPGRTIPEAFLAAARLSPDGPAVADQRSGVRTYRDLIASVHVLRAELSRLPGERLGIMLPASVAAATAYVSTLFAGKTPVMLNWTVGPRSMLHGVELTQAQRVLTSRALVAELASRGVDLSPLAERFVFLEDVAAGVPLWRKLAAAARARLGWRSLEEAPVPQTAAILFTSGSENLPKAVPLTHENILTNCRDVCSHVYLESGTRMIGMLPPFHSFGLTVTTILPLCAGVPVVYHPNPNDAATLARVVRAYGVTMLVSTPTFLGGILRASTAEQLATLRLVVTGAERCPERVYDALAERCPQALVLEGYGVTECSPIISVNVDTDPRRGTIGTVLPSLEHAVVELDGGERTGPDRSGMLLVRGPSVFAGYLGGEGESPFVEFEGRQWYRTGDLVTEAGDGVLTFCGRLKRFTKLGGEMISLPAIEAVLIERLAADQEGGPSIAVEASSQDGRPEIVLFTTLEVDRYTANRHIRRAGLSPLHNIRRVIKLPQLPVLGTGKTDYRALREGLQGGRK